MNKVFIILVFSLFYSCKNDLKSVSKKEILSKPEALESTKPQDTVVYFENTLTYQYEQNEVKEEL